MDIKLVLFEIAAASRLEWAGLDYIPHMKISGTANQILTITGKL